MQPESGRQHRDRDELSSGTELAGVQKVMQANAACGVQVREQGLKVSRDYSLPMLLATEAQVQDWKRPGLSPDDASLDSAALILCSPCWPFIFDEQVRPVLTPSPVAPPQACVRRVGMPPHARKESRL